MRSIALSVFVCLLAALALPAQVTVGGGTVSAAGIPPGATIWSGTAPPPNSVGANGDYYLNTTNYCLYGPMAAGAWPSTCASSVRQLGYVAENLASKAVPGGYAPLDANGLLPAANLPQIAAINGTSIPANAASDQTVVTTAPSVGAWAALPSCPDTGGNHLNYSLVTHGFLCGTTGGTAGSVSFGGVGSGINANSLVVTGTLSYSGAGQVNANQLSGTALAGLSTGLLKNTTGTGAPSIAGSSDVITTLGFTPENPANKGAAGGYAPLNASSQVPLESLPTIPYAQTSGVQAALGFTPASYPAAGVPVSTGSTWGTSYAIGTGPGNLVQLNSSSQLPAVSAALLTNWPTFNQSTTGTAAGLNGVLMSGLATGLVKNTTSTGAPSIAVDGTDFVSPAALNGGTLPASVTTVATTSNITSGGNVYANNGSSTAGCVQFGDTGQVHNTGICAPSSGVNALWNLPAALDTDGQVLMADGSQNLLWSSYWKMPHLTGLITFAPPAATSGTPTLLTVTGPAHTALAAGAEANDLFFNLNRTVQFTGGATITYQRAAYFTAPTYAFTSSSTTVSNAATVAISGPPTAGTNAVQTQSMGLWVQSGAAGSGTTSAYSGRFDAPTGATNNYALYANGRVLLGNGGKVAVDANSNLNAPVITGATGSASPTVTCTPYGSYPGASGSSPTTPASCSVTGTDVSGSVTLTTGSTTPAANSPLFTFAFGNTHTAPPGACMLQIQGAPLSVSQTPFIYNLPTTSGFSTYSGSSTALSASHTYYFSYICI